MRGGDLTADAVTEVSRGHRDADGGTQTIERAAHIGTWRPMMLGKLMGSITPDNSDLTPLWLKLLQQFGFPTVAICALSWAIWGSVRWAASEIVEPLKHGHLQFLDEVAGSVKNNSEAIKTVADTQQKIIDNQRSMLELMKDTRIEAANKHE